MRVGAAVVLVVALAACSSSSHSAATTSTSKGGSAQSRVSVWGDSLPLQAQDQVRVQGRAHGLRISVIAFFGLAPCDVMTQVRHDIETVPDALVLAFSGNNFSPCMQSRGKPLLGAVYFAAYRRDMSAIVAAAVGRKIPVLVVGSPTFPSIENVPDRVELNTVFREVVAAHPGARYVASAPFVSPKQFTRLLPCLAVETTALGCRFGRIIVRAGNGIHFDEPHSVPCPSGTGVCRYTAGGHRYANAILSGLAEIHGLSYVSAAANVGVPIDETPDG